MVRLPDGSTAPGLTEARTVHAGAHCTTTAPGLTVEVLAGTTRHATVAVTRVRE